MSVIDHLETEAEEKDPRERNQNNEKVQEELKIAYSRVSKEELEVLDDILKTGRGKKYPDLNEKVLKRTKKIWCHVLDNGMGNLLKLETN